MNYYNTDKSNLSKREKGTAAAHVIQQMWKKEFTLEFSRDRKSMSVYCSPNKPSKNGGAKMFCKVNIYMCSVRRTELCCVKSKAREKVIVVLYITLYLFLLHFKHCTIFLIMNIIFYIRLYVLYKKGAPEGLLDRCTHARVQGSKIPMSPAIKNEIMKHVKSYGTGKPLVLQTLLTLQPMI